MEGLLGLLIGVGLSAACGFRVFVPLLGMSVAAMSGHLTLSPGFEWIGSETAVVAFGVATLIEIGAYYIPWLDNALDSVATPAAVIAGTIVTASMVGDMSPFLKWSLAAIMGGGTAGIIQSGTVLLRGASSAFSGGLANPVVATGELAGASAITLLAILIPLVAVVFALALISYIIYRVIGSRRKAKEGAAT